MSEWQDLMPSAQLEPSAVVEVSWQGSDLLLYRTQAGKCAAISAYCPHQGNYIPNGLAPGQALTTLLVQDELRCPFHGWRFNGAGQCTHIPQGQRIPEPVKRGRPVIRHWRVREKNQQIQIATVC